MPLGKFAKSGDVRAKSLAQGAQGLGNLEPHHEMAQEDQEAQGLEPSEPPEPAKVS
jgi:hypothetical protein